MADSARPTRLVTATELGAHLDLSRQRVCQLVDEGVIQRGASGFDVDECRLAYLRWLRSDDHRSARSEADIYNAPSPNGAFGRFSIMAPTGGAIQMGAASGSLFNRAGGTVTGTTYLTIPAGMDAVWESKPISSRWSPTGGTYLNACASISVTANGTVAVPAGYKEVLVVLGSAVTSATIQFPSGPTDADAVILRNKAAATLAYSGGANSGAPASLSANSGASLRFSLPAATTWFGGP